MGVGEFDDESDESRIQHLKAAIEHLQAAGEDALAAEVMHLYAAFASVANRQ